jgi:glutaredoxin
LDDNVKHVPGREAGQIMLYALSTCVWCAKTKKLLDEMGVAYDYEYVDHLQGEAREQAIREVKNWNPACSFPTLVINDRICIVGFKEDEIRGVLKS